MSSLAAARADNFYYPPEWTPEQGSLNQFHGQHALRERARKLDQGILIIRFEMPFHVWCGGCGAMIAKGVRFNAEKKQIGNYHSTKIWSFKMKAACCQHEIEIHTDPKNCDYVVVSGAEKKTVDYDPEDAGTAALPTEEEKEQLTDPFFRAEHMLGDAKRAKTSKPELLQMKALADAKHADPWRINSKLRAQLRSQKKRIATEEEEARSKGLAIRLLPSSREDSQGAALALFKPKFEENRKDRRAAIRASSIFSAPCTVSAQGSIKDPVRSAPEVLRGRTDGAHGLDSGQKRRKRVGAEGGASADVPSGIVEGCGSESGSRVLHGKRKLQGPETGLHQHQCSGSQRGKTYLERQAELAAKRRRIDSRGVLAVAAGKTCF